MAADHVDVLIVTALASELSAVLALGEEGELGWKETVDRSGSTYHLREFTTEAGTPLRVAAAWSGQAGPEGVKLRTERLVKELEPPYVAVCGVCAGNSARVRLGDVIVADRIFEFEWKYETVYPTDDPDISYEGVFITKLRQQDLGATWPVDAAYLARSLNFGPELSNSRPLSWELQERWLLHALFAHINGHAPPPVADPERRLLCPDWPLVIERLRDDGLLTRDRGILRLTDKGSERVKEELLLYPDGLPAEPSPQIYAGAIATSDKLIRDAETFRILDVQVRHLLGIDMEVAAVAEIASQTDRKLIVVKSVVDLVDDRKDDRLHAWGNRASAEILLAALRKIIRPITRTQRKPSTELRDLSIDHITIHNFKNIHHLEIPFGTPSELPGHWTCITGLNGAGKSAILQAVVLVLLGDRFARDIGIEWLKRAQRTVEGEPQPATIKARVRWGGEMLDLVLPLGGSSGIDDNRLEAEGPHYKKMQTFWEDRANGHLLLAYGAGRNLSRRPQVGDENKSLEVRRQMTLFDPMTQVAAVEVLLNQSKHAERVLAMLKRILEPLLKDTEFAVDLSEEKLRFRVGSSIVDATELPDGFRATVAWLADLCAAWHDKAPDEAADGDPSKIKAIVLIDEIDLYLHASLQRTLVPGLRKALPNVQWIVTTHSPLVVSSFDRREIVLLELSAEGPKRRELDRQILGFSADEVYEYLMRVPPRSSALDEPLEGENAGARRVAILAQSPDVDEAKAKDDTAWLDDLAKEMEARRAAGEPE